MSRKFLNVCLTDTSLLLSHFSDGHFAYYTAEDLISLERSLMVPELVDSADTGGIELCEPRLPTYLLKPLQRK